MKKLFLVFIFGTGITFANAQTETNPQKTQQTKEVPQERQEIFENSKSPVRTEIKSEELLKLISDNITKDFADYEIEQAFKHENNGVVTYSVNVIKDISRRELIYDAKGNQLFNREVLMTPEEQKIKSTPPPPPPPPSDSIKVKRVK